MAASASAAPPVVVAASPPASGGRRGAIVDRNSARRDSVVAPRWDARGIVRIDHDVQVGQASLDGTTVVGGRLASGQLRSRGSLEVRGPLEVQREFDHRGVLEASGPVRVGSASWDGTARIGGDLAAASVLRVAGSLRANRVAAALVRLRGTATVAGLLTATSLDAELSGDSAFDEVHAHDVRIAGPVPNPVRWALGMETNVTVGRIEAESVDLVAVRAGFVRAPAITLGPAAHLVAYEGRIVRAHPSSRVGPESWSRPPAGLRR